VFQNKVPREIPWIQEDEVNIMRNFSLGKLWRPRRRSENKITVYPNMMGREADRTGSRLYTTVGCGVNGVDSSGSIIVV
jgi:hypothetical protein